jgi:hypothetical protein
VVGLLHIALNTKNAAYGEEFRTAAARPNCADDMLRWIVRSMGGASDAAHLNETWQQHTAAMEQLQKHVNKPEVLRQLLQTAVLNRHNQAAALLCRLSAISELSVSDATELIASALSTSSDDYRNTQLGRASLQTGLLSVLCRDLPAARRLHVSRIADMVSQAVSSALCSSDHASIQRPLLAILCGQLPAAKELPADLLVALIYALLRHSADRGESWIEDKDEMLETLLDLRAAREITQATAEDFLQLYLQQQMVYCLVRQPMQQLGAAMLHSLLFEACDWYG